MHLKEQILYLLKKGKIIEKGNYSKLKNNKKVLYKILNSKKFRMKKKFIFCFDIDNTICLTKGNNYKL